MSYAIQIHGHAHTEEAERRLHRALVEVLKEAEYGVSQSHFAGSHITASIHNWAEPVEHAHPHTHPGGDEPHTHETAHNAEAWGHPHQDGGEHHGVHAHEAGHAHERADLGDDPDGDNETELEGPGDREGAESAGDEPGEAGSEPGLTPTGFAAGGFVGADPLD